jgi:large subunit ribosomal protein L31e
MVEEESKVELEREYIINVRKQVMKCPIYRRAKKAIRTIKEFLAKHMKVENRDIRKVKIDKWLNQEVWFKGIKKPLMKVKVKAKKIDGIVYAELAEIPEQIRWLVEKDKKQAQEAKKEVKEEKKEETQTEEEKKEEKEKEKATQEAGLKENKAEAKQEKHTSKQQNVKINRMAMQR